MIEIDSSTLKHLEDNFLDYTFDMFMMNMSPELEEMYLFSRLCDIAKEKKLYHWEAVRDCAQLPEIEMVREDGERMKLINLSSYNYLGFSYHPEVIKAAQDAVAKNGLGAASTPIGSGTYKIHKDLEHEIIKFFGLKDRAVSLFTSGYGTNVGVIPAIIKPGNHVLLDSAAHMSMVEGARLSGGKVWIFNHNDMKHAEEILMKVCDGNARVLICTEGIFSADGDRGNIKELVRLAKKYGAFTYIDEAHSVLVAGENGRGVCEEQGVLDDVDFYVMTFTKAFGGIGGALIAKKEIVHYINFYARIRMFSCSLDPAVTGGMVKVVQLAGSEIGKERRIRIKENAAYFISLLKGKVNMGVCDSWVVTVICGKDNQQLELYTYLQRKGLDASIIQFPAVPKDESRMRLFVTSENTKEQLYRAAEIILDTAEKFNFLIHKND